MMKKTAALREDKVLSLNSTDQKKIELAQSNQVATQATMDIGLSVEDKAISIAMSKIAEPAVAGDSVNMFLKKNMETQSSTPVAPETRVNTDTSKRSTVRNYRQILKAYNKNRHVSDAELELIIERENSSTAKVVDEKGKTVPNMRKLKAARRDEAVRKEQVAKRALKIKTDEREAKKATADKVIADAKAEAAKISHRQRLGLTKKVKKQKRREDKAAKTLLRKAAKSAEDTLANIEVSVVEVSTPVVTEVTAILPEIVKGSALDQRDSGTSNGEMVERLEEFGYQEALLDERKAPFTNLLPKGQQVFWTKVLCEDGIVRRAQMMGELVTAESIAEARTKTLQARYMSKRATSSPEVNAANEEKIKSLVMDAVTASVVDIGIHPKHISNAIAEVQSTKEILNGFHDEGPRSVSIGPTIENAKALMFEEHQQAEVAVEVVKVDKPETPVQIEPTLVDSTPASAPLNDLDTRIEAMYATDHPTWSDALQDMQAEQEQLGQEMAYDKEFRTKGEMSLLLLMSKPSNFPGRSAAFRESIRRRRGETTRKIASAIFDSECKYSDWADQAAASDAIKRDERGFKIGEPSAVESLVSSIKGKFNFSDALKDRDKILAALRVAENKPNPLDSIMLQVQPYWDEGTVCKIERMSLATIAGVEREDERLIQWFAHKVKGNLVEYRQDYLPSVIGKAQARSMVLVEEHKNKISRDELAHTTHVMEQDIVGAAHVLRVKSVMRKLYDPALGRKLKKMKSKVFFVNNHLIDRLKKMDRVSVTDNNLRLSAEKVAKNPSKLSVKVEDVSMDSPFIVDMLSASTKINSERTAFGDQIMEALRIRSQVIEEQFTIVKGVLVPKYTT